MAAPGAPSPAGPKDWLERADAGLTGAHREAIRNALHAGLGAALPEGEEVLFWYHASTGPAEILDWLPFFEDLYKRARRSYILFATRTRLGLVATDLRGPREPIRSVFTGGLAEIVELAVPGMLGGKRCALWPLAELVVGAKAGLLASRLRIRSPGAEFELKVSSWYMARNLGECWLASRAAAAPGGPS